MKPWLAITTADTGATTVEQTSKQKDRQNKPGDTWKTVQHHAFHCRGKTCLNKISNFVGSAEEKCLKHWQTLQKSDSTQGIYFRNCYHKYEHYKNFNPREAISVWVSSGKNKKHFITAMTIITPPNNAQPWQQANDEQPETELPPLPVLMESDNDSWTHTNADIIMHSIEL